MAMAATTSRGRGGEPTPACNGRGAEEGVLAAGGHRAAQGVKGLPASGRQYPSIGGLGRHERRGWIAGREGFLQRLVLVVAGALLALAALERALLATAMAVAAILAVLGRLFSLVLHRQVFVALRSIEER